MVLALRAYFFVAARPCTVGHCLAMRGRARSSAAWHGAHTITSWRGPVWLGEAR